MRLSPDGHRYLAPNPPRPFSLRWLLPTVTSRDAKLWRIVATTSLIILPFVAWWWAGDWRAGAFALGLSGVMHINVRFPILVDATAMLFAVAAAASPWWLMVPLALLAGATNEKAPIFAALYAWNPLPLVGLLAVGWWRKPGPDVLDAQNADILRRPFLWSWRFHKPLPLWLWVLPWGAGLLAVLEPSTQLWVTLAVAYAMCAVATDTVRLYQWAWPVVALQTVTALHGAPVGVWVLAGVWHAINPFRSDGV